MKFLVKYKIFVLSKKFILYEKIRILRFSYFTKKFVFYRNIPTLLNILYFTKKFKQKMTSS